MSRSQTNQAPNASKPGSAVSPSPSWRPSTVTHDEDGVPIKFFKLLTGAITPNSLSLADKQELFQVCDMLAAKEKYQKAADILYPAVITDTSNAELKGKWLELIKLTNKQVMAQAAFNKEQSNKKWAAIDQAMAENPRHLSETVRYQEMREKGQLPPDKPNWALGKLMPWQAAEALSLAKRHQQNAVMSKDPFKKLDEYNEACRMYNQVLSVKNNSEEARGGLGDCIANMNGIYISLKKTKRLERDLNPDCPVTQVGDFMVSKNPWVQKARA